MMGGNRLATDPRDKIDAFFDISSDKDGLDFTPVTRNHSRRFMKISSKHTLRRKGTDVVGKALERGVLGNNIAAALRKSCHHSRFAVLSSDHYAMVPNRAAVEDGVYVLRGFSTPMALRRNESRSNRPGEDGASTYRMLHTA